MNTEQEIADLEAYIAGLPAELRDGDYGEPYKARLANLKWFHGAWGAGRHVQRSAESEEYLSLIMSPQDGDDE